MRTILVALVAVSLFLPATAQLEPGDEAPGFELKGIDGKPTRLADLAGRVVVLEWTSHLCPAVARYHESRIMGDTRAAIASEDVVWLQIDSSWFAPNLVGDIEAWRERLGLTEPYLLDTDGELARAYGAEATPHLYVIGGDGRLAYSGAVCNDASEAERENHVVAAVRALLHDEDVPVERTRAVGCTVKLGEVREAVAPGEIDEDHEPGMIYRRAVEAARQEDHDAATKLLERAFDAGLSRPWRVVADDDFMGLLERAEPRRQIRALLSTPARGALAMVAVSEPGEGLVIAGTIRAADGTAVPGAVVSLYHTDASGYYSPGSTSGENSRLFGRVAADAEGRYRIRTVMPGHYADSGGVPLHIHMGTRADGFRPAEGHRASIYFEGDPELVGASLAEIESDGCSIRSVEENAEGLGLVVHDIVLQRE